MAASANLARLHGERIGHLSRYDSTDLLRDELAAIAGLMQAAPVKFAFRKAFFGAGGKEEHWTKYAAPLMDANASASAASPLPASPQDSLTRPHPFVVPGPAMSPPVPTVSMVDEAVEPPTDEPAAPDEAEVPEESLPWEQLTAELAQAEPKRESVSVTQTAVGEMAQTELSTDCSLRVSQLADRGLAVKVEGSFGAGAYGGSRFLEEVNGAVQAGTSGVLLDLSRLSALRPDCSAPILACHIKLQSVGGRLAVIQPPDDAYSILEATGLTERVNCFDDEESAVVYLQPVCESAPLNS